METAAWLRGPLIGRGATATVSLAAATKGDNIFAVKSAPLTHSALLQREQTILASLNSPFILSSLGFEITKEKNGAFFYNLFLEYACGGSLSDDIKRRSGPLNEMETQSRARDILLGLAHLHNSGIVHCDLKPGNVLIGSDGRAKIGDLGCARWVAGGEREIRGSPMYMAPEAVRGEEQGMAADVWSFGCTVIEMVTGRPPWPDVTDAVEGINRIGFSKEVPVIPDCFSDEGRDFVNNCLKVNSTERWTVEELLRHPFVECLSSSSNCADFSWVSPKSTLDLRAWEFNEGEEVEDEEEFFNKPALGRIEELASGSADANWTWDGDWEDVRKVTGEYVTVAGGELGVGDFSISGEDASTSGGEVMVRDESCENWGWEKGDDELIRLRRKMGIVDNGDTYSLGFLIGSLLRVLVWHFVFGISFLV